MGNKRVSIRTLPSGEKVRHEPPDDAHPEGRMTLMTAPTTGVDEHQQLTFAGNPNGGDYLLGFKGVMTDPLKYNDNDKDMTDALCALSVVGVGNLTVTKGGSGLYDVLFANELGQQDVPLLDVDFSGLNRGSVVASVVTEGSAPQQESSLRTRLTDSLADDRERAAALKQSLLDRIGAKQADQQAKGVPPEKSPI